MIQSAKILGSGIATTGLIRAGVGIGVVFGALILGVSINSSQLSRLFSCLRKSLAVCECLRLVIRNY